MPRGNQEKNHKKKIDNQDIVRDIQVAARENLLPNIESKIKEVSEYISDTLAYDERKGLTATKVYNVIANRSMQDIAYITNKSYTPQEMAVAFNLYVQMMADINKYVPMPPSKASFCMLLGISIQCYNNYLQDPDMCEVMNLVETYITGTKLASAQLGETKEISTIFDLKSQHGFVEAQAPTTIIHEKKIDVDDIRAQLMEMKMGKKPVEIEYEEKE